MVLPGFLGDLVGLLCLLPVTRGRCRGRCWPALVLGRLPDRHARAGAGRAASGPAPVERRRRPTAGAPLVIEGEVVAADGAALTRTLAAPDAERPRWDPPGPFRRAACWGSAGAGTPAAQHLEALGEDLFEVLDGTALQQHVPVGARRLDLLRRRLGTADELGGASRRTCTPRCRAARRRRRTGP